MDKEYTGAVKIQSFSSKGRVSRILGRKTGRIHHLLSDLETNVFYLLDFHRKVIDIKEHYDLNDVREIVLGDDISGDKFKDKKTGKEYAVTTTFLITLANAKIVAISCKNQSELYKSNTQLKLEIERRYWNHKGIEWGLITNKDVPLIRLKNIKWILLGCSGDLDKSLVNIIKETMFVSKGILKDFIRLISESYNYEEKLVLSTIKAMILNDNLIANLDKEITLESNLNIFKFEE